MTNLPENIKKEILNYLHLEYGEDPKGSLSLKLEEIMYDGLYEIAGVPTHYFTYKSSTGHAWAVVKPFGDSYVIGMTTHPPKPVTNCELYCYVSIKNPETDYSHTFELESWGEGCYGFSDYKEVTLPNGKTFSLLTEVSSHSDPVGVTLSIIDEETNVYIRGSVGLLLSYESKRIGSLIITLGTGPWE